ncbi:hypothetical protein HZR84_03695 [Hyphobacterium sp. CCMP332]|nr:hypothetical protein HZR84_03695 [Hyphobacterium sp. CCMP332]
MNKLFKILPIIAFTLSHSLLAQNNEGELEDIEVVIQKNKDITLPRANRNYQKISEIPQPEIKPSAQMQFGEHRIGLSPLDPSIRINKLKSEGLDKLYGNYVRGGIGNYANTYLEAFLGNKREDKGYYNIYVGHNAFGSGPVEDSDNSRNHIAANGGIFYDNYSLSANAFYDRQHFNFYGLYPPRFVPIIINPEDEPMDQLFNRIGLSTSLSKTDPLDYLNFELGIGFEHLDDKFNQNENWLSLNLDSDYELNVGKKIRLNARYILANYSLDTFSSTRHLTEIAPQYVIETGNFEISGGLKMSIESDTNLQGDFHLYPLAHIEYKLLDEKLIPYAGIEGGIVSNGLNSFAAQNPFLDEGNILSHSNKELEIKGGLRTSLLKKSLIDVYMSYSAIDNLPLFINNTINNRFLVLYAENASIFTAGLTFNTKPLNNLEFGVSLEYRNYGFSDTTKAWHLPSVESHIYSKFNIQKKIYMNVDIFSINGIFAYTTMEAKRALDDILDINLQLEYKFSERFSTFVELKNILSNEYQRYLFYDNRGIQARAGLTYTF